MELKIVMELKYFLQCDARATCMIGAYANDPKQSAISFTLSSKTFYSLTRKVSPVPTYA